MKLTFLGTGTSVGVPTIGCNCEVCRSNDPHDKRLRASAMVETDTTRLLLDCGPDFRQQMLEQEFRKIDAVLLTHIHYDHVSGIDDLRPFCRLGDIDIYANQSTADGLRQTIPYCFVEHLYPGVPKINLHTLTPHSAITIGNITVLPFVVNHDKLPILAYRITTPHCAPLVYITDMKTIDASELPYAHCPGATLVVNALRFTPNHHSHLLVDEAIAFARQTGAQRTFLTHMNHDIGKHEEVNKLLPSDICLAYDRQAIDL